jgi:FKBP-type peptidyl-prolyl cis-trans isomerase
LFLVYNQIIKINFFIKSMENKNSMNIIVAVVICLAVVGILVFISINNKTNKENTMPANNNIANTNDQTAPATGDTTQTGQVAKTGDTVAMNYTGRLQDGTVFDSNVDPKFKHVEPFVFTLGAGQVIAGWDKGIVGMKVGEKKTLVILPADGYGAAGAGGVIPPNATLTFDVELLAIKK